jgi:phage-related minor tail protein
MKPWLKATEWLKGQQWLKRKQTWAIVGVVVLALAVMGFGVAWKAEQL